MLDLYTAEDMYQYCIENKLGTGINKSWAVKHFQLIMDNLQPNEVVHCVFIGLHYPKNGKKHDGHYAYAMTDTRLLMAQHKMFGANIQSVSIENINDITLAKRGVGSIGIGLGRIVIDTIREEIGIAVNITFADNVYERAHEVWDMVRTRTANANQAMPQFQKSDASAKSAVDYLKEYKELLDMGILTQEEFDAKKSELLGL